ncbi:hypothetical protein [Tenacibaculum jejuense]|uniref:hypothetical protein n=1 Tax=Tenacibaculum jejuense TaxID=584609 RepID=UPI000BA363ED|nr:hypothetical protein [Tenacibaculum jejuense]
MNLFANTKYGNIDSLLVSTKKGLKSKIKSTKLNSGKQFRTFKSLSKFDKLEDDFVPVKEHRFTEEGYQFTTKDSLENKRMLDLGVNTFLTVEETGNYIDVITKDGLAQLPVATKPISISNVKYTMGIAKAVFKPAFTELTVFLKIEFPNKNEKRGKQELILGASNVKLSHDGGIIGDAKLHLISQFTVNYNKGAILLTLKGSFEKPGTYAIVDCSGFKELGIDANIKFANGLLHPVDKKGKKKVGYVEADFKTSIADWNDLVVNISLPEFGVKGLEGTTFQLNTAVFDFSDLRNDDATPTSYLNKYYKEEPTLWRGVYVKSLKVILPPEFKIIGKGKDRMSFGATDLIIDNQGITGKFIGENIIGLDEGDASGWPISLDYFLLDIETNNLKAGKFNGRLKLPTSQLDSLKYSAVFQPGEYKLRVETEKNINFDLWDAAEVNLRKDSYIEMLVKNGAFRPKASLSGDVTIKAAMKPRDPNETNKKENDSPISFEGIEFEKMVIQTESPIFSVKYFGTKGRLGLSGFPVSIDKIGLETPTDKRANLIIGLSVNLTSESDGGNGGSSTLVIKAKHEDRKWKFDGVTLEKLFVEMDVAGTQLKGAIFIFDDNPTYGTGFAGALGAKFEKGLGGFEVQVKALFGRTKKFRYWFADGQVSLTNGFPVFTGFSLNTFGGGLYNRMKMVNRKKKGDKNKPNSSDAFNNIGASSSGIVYEPYEDNAFGFKAAVGIVAEGSEDLFNASVEFGMAFNRRGGLQEIYLKGTAKLLSSLPNDFSDQVLNDLDSIAEGDENPYLPAKEVDAAMAASLYIGFDFVNDIFQTTAEVYINFGIIRGIGNYGRAGWLDFYVAPDEWHLLVGTPQDRIGVTIDLVLLEMEMGAYFMTGDNLPGSPPPPPQVADILGLDIADLDYMRDLNNLESGKGLAFGASLKVSTGDLTFLIFYARFEAGVGFDIMVKDYGDAHCKGSSEPIGMNGWYANGQAYAFLQGELGLTFRLFGFKTKIPIISGGGAVLLQAKLPNPSWFRGYLGGKFNLLGGLIKGSFRFKVELGEKCEIVGGSPIDDIVVISDLKPKDGSADVDVFAAPQAVFNLQVNKVFELPDETGDRKYKILLDEFSVSKDGQKLEGEVKWSNNNDAAAFYSHEILPPNSNLKAYIQLHFEEFKNGRWEVMQVDGKRALETKEVTFTTGEAPKTIPLNNIEYMYPVLGQKNFFIEEYGKAYINLKRGQNYLFEQSPGWDKTMVMNSKSGTVFKKSYTYNAAKKQLVYTLPEKMTYQTEYDVSIILSSGGGDVNDNISTKTTKSDLGNEGEASSFDGKNKEDSYSNSVEKSTRVATGEITKDGKRELLFYDFRTSKYATFNKKMNSINVKNDLYQHIIYPYGVSLLKSIDRNEAFDLVELEGNEFSGNKPIIQARAVLDNSYYKRYIFPLLYENYPLEGEITVSRKTDEVGVPPVEAIQPLSWYVTYLESGEEAETTSYYPYSYNVTNYFWYDYEDLAYQVLDSDFNWRNNPRYVKLISEVFPYMREGKYKTTFKYILPGSVQKGKERVIKYVNPIND